MCTIWVLHYLPHPWCVNIFVYMCTLLAFGSSGHHTSCYVPQLVLCFYGLMWLEHFQSYASLHAFLSLVMFSTGTWKRFLQSPPSVSGWQKDLLVWMESSQHGRNHCFFVCLFVILFTCESVHAVQFKMGSMHLEKHICTATRISEVSPMLPLKQC